MKTGLEGLAAREAQREEDFTITYNPPVTKVYRYTQTFVYRNEVLVCAFCEKPECGNGCTQ